MNFVKKMIRYILRPIKKTYITIDSKHKLKKSINNKTGPIVFICQCEYIWNKRRDVFLQLLKEGTSPILYVIKDQKSVSTNNVTIFEKEFPNYVCKYEEKKLIDLKPSIVIYSRPYSHYLPKDVRINKVLKYAKTMYIPYYFTLDDLVTTGINDLFYKYLSVYYADQEEVKTHFDYVQRKNISKGLQKCYNFGYPVFENLYLNKNDECIYKNSYNKHKVMWTPRWTLDEKLGGSNFLKYYKNMFSYFLNNEKYSFVFRPHPLLFSNFIETGVISIEEKNEILDSINHSNNSVYDTSSEYINTFFNTDCLITDNSSIIVEYFITGKPMIFCYNDSNLVFNNIMNKILECNYVVNTFDEILEILNKLNKGIDEKKELRNKYVSDFKESYLDSSKNIANNILSNKIKSIR